VWQSDNPSLPSSTTPEEYCSMWDLPLPGTEMVSLLLDRGADPNGCDPDVSSLTPWESALSYAMRIEPIGSSPHNPIFGFKEQFGVPFMMGSDLPITKRAVNYHAVRRSACRYIQIMQKLLLVGANPNARVADHWQHQQIFSALDIVKNNLVEAFPLEAAPLLKALQQALALQDLGLQALALPVLQKEKKRQRYETTESGDDEGMRRDNRKQRREGDALRSFMCPFFVETDKRR
jgi:ankyrin repeat protein